MVAGYSNFVEVAGGKRREPVDCGLKYISAISGTKRAVFAGYFGLIGVSAVFYLRILVEHTESLGARRRSGGGSGGGRMVKGNGDPGGMAHDGFQSCRTWDHGAGHHGLSNYHKTCC